MLTFGVGTLSSAVKVFRLNEPSENLPASPISPRVAFDPNPAIAESARSGRSRGPPAAGSNLP